MTGRTVWLLLALAATAGASASAAPLSVSGSARLSRFAQPGTLAEEARLRDAEERALQVAGAAVDDMRRLARSKAETELAARDGTIVGTIDGLVRKRRQIREREEMLSGPGGGMGFRGSMTGGGGSSPIRSAAGGDGQSQLMQATQQMQETQMSFNLQYLQLQSAMQAENRAYTAVSNIVRVKHDTVKNSIGNIR